MSSVFSDGLRTKIEGYLPDIYPVSWAWITGDLTEHEMEEEHGMELERIKAQQGGELKEFGEAGAVGAGRIYATRRERSEEEGKKTRSSRRFYGIVQGINETIKNWKGT